MNLFGWPTSLRILFFLCLLFTLVSVKRVSKHLGLANEGWGFLAFSFTLDFIMKTQKTSVADEQLENIFLSFLSDFVRADKDEMMLCPVTAVCPACKHLLVSTGHVNVFAGNYLLLVSRGHQQSL